MPDEKVEKIAAQFYDPKLQYHNFGHIRYVLNAGTDILERCHSENVNIDDTVVYYAILFHDAGYMEDHIAKGYESKEALSADIAVEELEKIGINSDTTRKVKQAILATHVDARCISNEDIAVRAADLSGLADSYQVFKENTLDLKHEYEMMSGNELTWDQWKTMAADRIELFLREELKLTSDYYNENGESVFHINTRANINRLLEDNSETLND